MGLDIISNGMELVTAGVGLARTVIDKVSEKSIDNEAQTYENKMQDGFANNNSDELWAVCYGLCSQAGNPPAPTGGAGASSGGFTISRELLHSMMLALIKGQKDARLLARALNTVLK